MNFWKAGRLALALTFTAGLMGLVAVACNVLERSGNDLARGPAATTVPHVDARSIYLVATKDRARRSTRRIDGLAGAGKDLESVQKLLPFLDDS